MMKSKIWSALIVLCAMTVSFSACELLDDDDSKVEGVGLIAECNISQDIQDLYEEDAIRLALREQQNGPAAGEIQIPQALIDRMLAALSAIDNGEFQYTPEFVARDTVIDRYKIHTLPYPAFDELTLAVDTSVAWVQEWVDGNRLTGNMDIDNLMTIYGLDLAGDVISLNLGEVVGNIVTITSSQPLNLQGLLQNFETIEGIVGGDFVSNGGSGNDINVVDNGSSLEMTYTVGYDTTNKPGECEGSCEFSRSWVFEVENTDCSASYIQSFGDEAPE